MISFRPTGVPNIIHLYFQRSCTFRLWRIIKTRRKETKWHHLFPKAKKRSQGHSGNSNFTEQILHVMKSMLYSCIFFSLLHVFILSKPGWRASQLVSSIQLIIHWQYGITQSCLILASTTKRPLLGGGLSTYPQIGLIGVYIYI